MMLKVASAILRSAADRSALKQTCALQVLHLAFCSCLASLASAAGESAAAAHRCIGPSSMLLVKVDALARHHRGVKASARCTAPRTSTPPAL